MHLFRFTAAVALVVSISLLSIALEKRRLELQRAISLQQYRTDQLLERRAQLVLRVGELTSPMHSSNDRARPPRAPANADDFRRQVSSAETGIGTQ